MATKILLFLAQCTVAGALTWPVAHCYVVHKAKLSAWRFAGWGMYSEPLPRHARIVVCGNSGLSDEMAFVPFPDTPCVVVGSPSSRLMKMDEPEISRIHQRFRNATNGIINFGECGDLDAMRDAAHSMFDNYDGSVALYVIKYDDNERKMYLDRTVWLKKENCMELP